MTRTLLETPHGSRLYRLDHAGSDHDRFVVLEDSPTTKARYAKHRKSEHHDLVVTDLSTFFQYASMGRPQFLEAMWTPVPTVDLLTDVRYSFQPDYYVMQETYQRTADGMYKKGQDLDDDKFRRHSYRIILNLLDYLEYGSFCPAMTDKQITRLDQMVVADRDPLSYLLHK